MTLVHSLIKPAREVQVGWEIHCADRHDRLRVEWVGRDHRGQVLLSWNTGQVGPGDGLRHGRLCHPHLPLLRRQERAFAIGRTSA